MNKKGFTLIELSLVSVILIIITAISIYTTITVVDKSEKEIFLLNVLSMIKGAKDSFTEQNFNNNTNNILFSNISLEDNVQKLENNNGYNYKIKIFLNNNSLMGYYAIDDNKKYSTYGVIPFDEISINENFISSSLVLFTDDGIKLASDLDLEFYKNIACDDTLKNKGYITYEDFYAVSDGKTNDANAIYYAHECANKLNIPINSNKGIYYISNLPIINGTIRNIQIKTNVNWNNSKIIIDNTDVISDDERNKIVFDVARDNVSISTNMNLNYSENTVVVPEIIEYLRSKNINSSSYYVSLKSSTDKIYRADESTWGKWQEFFKSDYFKIDSQGNVLNKILYNYNDSTSVYAYPISDETLKLENVDFVTIGKPCVTGKTLSCSSTSRNFRITRSNVMLDNFEHYLIDNNMPTYYGSGFLSISNVSDITIKNSNFRAHMYRKNGYNGNTGGTYDIMMNYSSNITFDNVGYTCNEGENEKECYYKNIIDNYQYGITGNNHIKDLKITNSILNRIDSHLPAHNLTVDSSILGWSGIAITGGGNLVLKNSSIDQADSIIVLRTDYGSSWKGNININNIYYNTRDYNKERERGNVRRVPIIHKILQYKMPGKFNGETGFGFPLYIPSLDVSNVFINEENLVNSINEYNKKYNNNQIYNGVNLVQNVVTTSYDSNDDEFKQKPTLYGEMRFNNIRSDTYSKLNVNHVFIGSSITSDLTGESRVHKSFYKNYPLNIYLDSSSISNQDYSYDSINENESITNLEVTNNNHAYCEIKVSEKITDDWYTSDILNVTLEYPDGYNIIDYGLGYNAYSYNKVKNMKILKSKNGVFNIYGYIKDDMGNIYNCIKLIKKTN